MRLPIPNRRVIGVLAAVFVCLWLPAHPALAQPVSNPRTVDFLPSPDHDRTASNGQALVSSYELQLFQAGASQPFHTVNLGKPGRQADGRIRVDFSGQIAAWPLPGGTYVARVAAVGPGGRGTSTTSNQFTFGQAATPPPSSQVPSDPGCSLRVSPRSAVVSQAGGTVTVSVATAAGCTWTVRSGATWASVSPTSGAGSSRVTLRAAANPGSAARSASVSIGGATIALGQEGVPVCRFDLTPESATLPPEGGNAVVTVSAPSGCAWSARASARWLRLSAASGRGPGAIQVSAAPNRLRRERTGMITVGSQVFTVTVEAGRGPSAPRNPKITIGG